ncbi:MAG TPA: zf-HC2 domain-containing protein [Desulfosporosinus sp.]|nr:zf-HC2 domain-containing protein [Desulfosporosinus sp.]
MTCYRSRDNWHSYVKNSLSEAELETITTHLTQCPECRDLVSIIHETADFLAKTRIIFSPPASMKLNVMSAIDSNRYKKVSSHVFELKNWGFSMVAGGLLLLALNLTSLAPTLQSGQVAEFFDKISHAAYAAMMKIETITQATRK